MILSFDISSTKIGVCLLDKEEKIVFKDFILLNNKISLIRRADDFFSYCSDLGDKYGRENIEKILVEEPFISVTGGAGQAWTTAILHKFSAMCWYCIFVVFGIEPISVSPMTYRSKLGIKIPRGTKGKFKKQVIIDFVTNYFGKQFTYEKTKQGNFVKGTDDICDAIVLALYGRKYLSD